MLLRSTRVTLITQKHPLCLNIFAFELFPDLLGDPGLDGFGVAKVDTFVELTRELSSLGNREPSTDIPKRSNGAGFLVLPPDAIANISAGNCDAMSTFVFFTFETAAAGATAAGDDGVEDAAD